MANQLLADTAVAGLIYDEGAVDAEPLERLQQSLRVTLGRVGGFVIGRLAGTAVAGQIDGDELVIMREGVVEHTVEIRARPANGVNEQNGCALAFAHTHRDVGARSRKQLGLAEDVAIARIDRELLGNLCAHGGKFLFGLDLSPTTLPDGPSTLLKPNARI